MDDKQLCEIQHRRGDPSLPLSAAEDSSLCCVQFGATQYKEDTDKLERVQQ